MRCGELVKDEVEIQWVLPDQSVFRAAELMAAHQLGWLPVCANDFRPVGVITDHDIVIRVLAKRRAPACTRVAEVMSSPVHGVPADCPADAAVEIMGRLGISHLVVLDGGGRLEGVISHADLTCLIAAAAADSTGSASPLDSPSDLRPLPATREEVGSRNQPGEGRSFLARRIWPRRAAGIPEGEPVAPSEESQASSPSWLVSHAPSKHGSMLAWAVACALLVRLLVFAFAENKLADAPMRALLAEYRSSTFAVARDPGNFHQFGPLPIELIRSLLALGGDVRVISRVPSLIAGIALLLPFIALARRMTGDGRVIVVSTLALALSPLATQLSTTAASESIYLLFWLACLERLHAALSANRHPAGGAQADAGRTLTQRRRNFLLAGMWASLAAVSRYDAWLAIPGATAAVIVFGRRDLRLVLDLALFVAAAAVLPVAYLVWLRAAGADPWRFARIISGEHAAAAAQLAAQIGSLPARLHQVVVWVLGLAAAMTPIGLLGLPLVAAGWRRLDGATRVVAVAAAAPMLLYLTRGLLLNDFAPQARFALVPGICLLPLAIDALASRMGARTLQVSTAAGAFAFVAVVSVLAFGRHRAGMGEAETFAPITRLDPDARAVADYLSTQRRPTESVFVDTQDYVDIVIAHAARVPLPLVATLWRSRALGDSLAEENSRSQATLFAAHDASWGSRPLLDWPPTGLRFGHWRVARVK